MCSKVAQKVTKYLGSFVAQFVTLNISKSDHTGCS